MDCMDKVSLFGNSRDSSAMWDYRKELVNEVIGFTFFFSSPLREPRFVKTYLIHVLYKLPETFPSVSGMRFRHEDG